MTSLARCRVNWLVTTRHRYDLVMIPRQRPGKYLLQQIRVELRTLLAKIEAGKGRKRRVERRGKR